MEETNENEVKDICKNILQLVKNKDTKIKVEETNKNSYYVFLNDTIYLSTRQTSNNRKDTRLVLMCHECIHSLQSKLLQWMNFILANLELAFFVAALVLKYIFKQEFIVPIYFAIAIFSIIIRGILEADASIRSISLAQQYLESGDKVEGIEIDIDKIKKKMLLTFPLFVISLFGAVILRLIIILI